jgi:hypothetical protein
VNSPGLVPAQAAQAHAERARARAREGNFAEKPSANRITGSGSRHYLNEALTITERPLWFYFLAR